jgi:GT2 family glycosyltransferase
MVEKQNSAPSPKRRCQIGYITVNYNSAQATALLLSDLLKQNTLACDLAVVVADNSPSETELSPVRETYRNCPSVRFERMPRNLGYFGAAHLALATVWKDVMPDWIIVSNADIRLPQPDFFSRITELPTGVGVIAPRIISGRTGLDQNPMLRHRLSVFRLNLVRLILRVPLLYWLMHIQASIKHRIRSHFLAGLPPSDVGPESIYAPHGAFMLFGSEYFKRGGTLDCGAFLYAEEIFVAETSRRINVEVKYVPSLIVLHDEHVATAANPSIRHFQREAADYFHREFFAKVSR